MTVGGRVDDWSGPCGELDALMVCWRSADTIRHARAIINDTTDRRIRTQARMYALGAMINLGWSGDRSFTDLLDETHTELTLTPVPALHAEFHVLCGGAAMVNSGDIRTAVSRVASARRALETGVDTTLASCTALRDLANLESTLGMVDQAILDQRRADEFDRRARPWQQAGLLLESALTKDHNGDTDACVDLLTQAARPLTRHDRVDGDDSADAYRGYALARLTAFGEATTASSERFFPVHRDDPIANCYRLLTKACAAIGSGAAHRALLFLEAVTPSDPVAAAEVLRLRSLAHTARGDHTAAWLAEREMFRMVTADLPRMRRLAVDGAAMALERGALRSMLRQRENEAFTDRLTGLSNRRHFELMWSGPTRPRQVVIGMLDLDGFKQVNTNHGHAVGDRVLRRAAEVLQGALRDGDFLARFGGDEFVAVLADTSVAEARQVGHRVRSRMAREDWRDVGSRVRVGVTIGWSALDQGVDVTEALRRADAAMYAAKARR